MKKLRGLREYSPRDLLVVGLPLLLLVVAGFWLASRFIQPTRPGCRKTIPCFHWSASTTNRPEA